MDDRQDDPPADPGGRPAVPAPPPGPTGPVDGPAGPEDVLWHALCLAPAEGADIAELMRASGMSRPTVYRYLAAHARAGRVFQVSRGRWRALTTPDGDPQ